MFAPTVRLFTTFAGLGVMALALLPASAAAQADGGRPVTWNTFLGGGFAGNTTTPARDELESVITSRAGEVYVTGRTNAGAFPKTQDGQRNSQDSDVVVTRLSADGGVMWSRVFGGPEDDYGKRVLFHHPNEGHLVVAGTTKSASIRDGGFPVLGNFVGNQTAFLARVELDGKISWFMYLGTPVASGLDEVQDLAIFPDRQWAYVVGGANNDAFVIKASIADAGPAPIWAKRFGTADSVDEAYAVSVHTEFESLLYVGGRVGAVKTTDTSIFPPMNSYGGGVSDGFLTRLDANGGAMQWFRFMGGNQGDEVRDLLQQATGGFTIIGNTSSSDYPPQQSRPGANIFLGRLIDVNGTVAQERLIGAGGETMLGHAASDRFGNIYFGGSTVSPNLLAINAFDPFFEPGTGGFNDDGFIAMADRNLQRIAWASYVGGSSLTSEAIRGVSAVPHGYLTFVGSTSAGSGVLVPGVPGEYRTANGGSDGVIFRMPVDQGRPIPGTVQARFSAGNRVSATWSGFRDNETDIEQYQVQLLSGGLAVEIDDLPYTATSHTFDYVTNTASQYEVKVIAVDLFDLTAEATSGPVVRDPPDAGPGDGGSGVDGGSDAGPDVPEEDTDKVSPVGWGCGSAGGGTLLGLVVLLLSLAVLSRRSQPPG